MIADNPSLVALTAFQAGQLLGFAVKLLWADAAYVSIIEKVRKNFGWNLEIVRRSDKAKGFEILHHRWIVERIFGWLGRYRHLSRDFEHTVSSSESREWRRICVK